MDGNELHKCRDLLEYEYAGINLEVVLLANSKNNMLIIITIILALIISACGSSNTNSTPKDKPTQVSLNLDELNTHQIVEQYIKHFVIAVNNKDFSQVEPFLQSSSQGYTKSKKIFDDLVRNGVKVELVKSSVDGFGKGLKYFIDSNEEYNYTYSNGQVENKKIQFKYIVNGTTVKGPWRVGNFEQPDEAMPQPKSNTASPLSNGGTTSPSQEQQQSTASSIPYKENSVDGWVFSNYRIEMHPKTNNFHLYWQAVNVSNKQNDIRPAARFVVKKPGGPRLYKTLGEIGTSTKNDGRYFEDGKSTISVFPRDSIGFTSLWELPSTDKSPDGYVLYYIDALGNITPLCNL